MPVAIISYENSCENEIKVGFPYIVYMYSPFWIENECTCIQMYKTSKDDFLKIS
jgi:hypothetical protein